MEKQKAELLSMMKRQISSEQYTSAQATADRIEAIERGIKQAETETERLKSLLKNNNEQLKRTLDYIENTINRAISTNRTVGLSAQLPAFAEFAARINSEKVAQMILEVPELIIEDDEHPENAYSLMKEKIRALRLLKDFPGVREYVLKSLNHEFPQIQVSAASVLLSWGEKWELAGSEAQENVCQ